MFMATKKPTFKKQTPVKPSLSENLKKKWWAVLLLAIFVFTVGAFAYNRYLDYKNVQDMKTLLSDFQQLEKTMEEQTSESIESTVECTYGGEKFNQKESCNLLMINSTSDPKYFNSIFYSSNTNLNEACRLSVGGSNVGSIACYIPNTVLENEEIQNIIREIIDCGDISSKLCT